MDRPAFYPACAENLSCSELEALLGDPGDRWLVARDIPIAERISATALREISQSNPIPVIDVPTEAEWARRSDPPEE